MDALSLVATYKLHDTEQVRTQNGRGKKQHCIASAEISVISKDKGRATDELLLWNGTLTESCVGMSWPGPDPTEMNSVSHASVRYGSIHHHEQM